MEKDIKDEEIEVMNEEEIDNIVVITDKEGNESYFAEEMVIPVGDKNFAILVGIDVDGCCEDEECCCHDHEDGEEDDDENVIIARMEFDEDGEPVYVAPTDEEFEQVKAAYEQIAAGWDEE